MVFTKRNDLHKKELLPVKGVGTTKRIGILLKEMAFTKNNG